MLIRITPGVAGDTHHAISTGQADSKFGFSPSTQAREAIAPAARPRRTWSWSACTSTSARSCSSSSRSAPRCGRSPRSGDFPVYNLGGGLGVAYTADQQPPAIERVRRRDRRRRAHAELGPGKRLLLEPGRALVANSTVTLYTVETVKRNVSTWVAVDGGMSDNLRPMLYGAAYEALVADRPLARGRRALPPRRQALRVRRRDRARRARCADPAPGDVIATPATGAYGYSLANNYNGVPRPPVIFCRDGDGPRGRAPRDLRGPDAARDVGRLTRVPGRAARPRDGRRRRSRRCCPRTPTGSSGSPGCGPSCRAC